jgi:hypothetical protein
MGTEAPTSMVACPAVSCIPGSEYTKQPLSYGEIEAYLKCLQDRSHVWAPSRMGCTRRERLRCGSAAKPILSWSSHGFGKGFDKKERFLKSEALGLRAEGISPSGLSLLSNFGLPPEPHAFAFMKDPVADGIEDIRIGVHKMDAF